MKTKTESSSPAVEPELTPPTGAVLDVAALEASYYRGRSDAAFDIICMLGISVILAVIVERILPDAIG